MGKELETPLKAEYSWFHVFRTMFVSGEVGNLGPHAFTVYCAIKAHIHFQKGTAFPSYGRIQEMTGISKPTISKALNVLERHGYLTKETKPGRSSRYTLRERIPLLNGSGEEAAVATWDYVPGAIKQAQAELKKFLLSGSQEGTVIHIKQLNLQINFAENNKQNIIDASREVEAEAEKNQNPYLREIAQRARAKIRDSRAYDVSCQKEETGKPD
jgi:DNA-binding MarR family transcriptional regulator